MPYFALLLILTAPAGAEDPWADAVVSFNQGSYPVAGPFSDPAQALGAPSGGGTAGPDNSSLVCLGSKGGALILRFDTPVSDDPRNPLGLDCIVYGNSFWVGGGPDVKWQEPAIIEISADVNGNGEADDPWYLIPGSRGYAYPIPGVDYPLGQDNASDPFILAGNIENPSRHDESIEDILEFNWGYAEMTPALAPLRDNYVRPENPFLVGYNPTDHMPWAGGGDAFDIAWAIDAEGNPAGLAQFDFLRLSAFIERELGGGLTDYASPEIDAAADVAPNVDSDGDGVVDDYEVRVAGTDPLRPESTIVPLEIGTDDGGSNTGTLLAEVWDNRGSNLRLFAAEERSFGAARQATIDILAPSAPGGGVPNGMGLSGTVREIVFSEGSFTGTEIAPAEVTIIYAASEIAGLDEASLTPLLHTGTQYTQAGIAGVSVDLPANKVTFTTAEAGLFVLAAPSGSGETSGAPAPAGLIRLHADPPNSAVADPADMVRIESAANLTTHGELVADGTPFTVSASAGTVLDADVDASAPGIQVASQDGRISFTVAPSATAQAGVTFSAASVEGGAAGTLDYVFRPGTPAGVVMWTAEAMVELGVGGWHATAGPIVDGNGNAVADGTLLTVVLENAAFDPRVNTQGTGLRQVVVYGGMAHFYAQADPGAEFLVSTYGDPARTGELGVQLLPSGNVPGQLTLASGLLTLALSAVGTCMLRLHGY